MADFSRYDRLWEKVVRQVYERSPVEKHNLSDSATEQRQEPRGKARTPVICRVPENGMTRAFSDTSQTSLSAIPVAAQKRDLVLSKVRRIRRNIPAPVRQPERLKVKD